MCVLTWNYNFKLLLNGVKYYGAYFLGVFLDKKIIMKKTKESSKKWYNFELLLQKLTDE